MTAGTAWKVKGLCAARNDNLFFPESNKREAAQPALDLCNACPVVAECLAWAMAQDIREGIWGATTAEDRANLRRGNKLRLMATEYASMEHGTIDTAKWERRNGITVCAACLLAERRSGTSGYGVAKTYGRASA